MKAAKILGVLLLGSIPLAEASARYLGFGDPLIYRSSASGYELVPGQKVTRLGRISTINNIGARGSDIALVPRRGVNRILVLGDSVANGGNKLGDNQILSHVSSVFLNKNGCRSELINVSAGGWSLFDEISWVRKHGLFSSTNVVWIINYMDLDQPRSSSSYIDHYPSLPSKKPPFALWEIITRYVIPGLGIGHHAADNGSIGGLSFDDVENQKVVREVLEFRSFLAKSKVKMTVVYHDGLEPTGKRRQGAVKLLHTKLTNLGVTVVDTGLSRLPNAERYFLDKIHPNAAGHNIIGRKISKEIIGSCK